jgi:hypothetical protein
LAGADVGVYGEFLAVNWAVPDFVVTFTGSVIATVASPQNVLDTICVACHAPSKKLDDLRQVYALFVIIFRPVVFDRDLEWLARIERVSVEF